MAVASIAAKARRASELTHPFAFAFDMTIAPILAQDIRLSR